MGRRLWTPSEERINNSNMKAYMDFLREEKDLDFKTYDDLWQWSVTKRASFWASLCNFYHTVGSKRADKSLENPDDMLESKWFVGSRFNFAENLLRYRDDHTAIIFKGEAQDLESITYAELYDKVAQMAGALRGIGIKKDDRVGGFIPNNIEAIVAFLATASIGAIWSSTSPDFGIKGVYDRFGQIEPKVLFCANGYSYNGRNFDSLEKVRGIVSDIKSIEHVIVVPYTEKEPDISGVPGAVMFDDFLSDEKEITFEQLPFDHPLYILYSSGTTGVPKCMVHSSGGSLMQHIKELMLHSDVKRESVLFYFTTCGWMMWNWQVSGLALGATLLLFDGSPFYPDPGALWKLAQDTGMTHFGTSAKYIASVEDAGLKPGKEYDMSKLEAVMSTGSPLSKESFNFVYNEIKEDVHLASISGGSDIVSCFMLGNPMLPVHEEEIQCRGLGMDVDVFDDNGNSLKGQQGELVCKSSFPSQPIYFWNDPGKEKYKAAYFDVYPGIWRHGDFSLLTEHNGIVMFGRSDATLNPGGVRIGTSEIYNVVENMEEVADAVVVGQNWEDDVRVILFVQMAEGQELTEELIKKMRTDIRSNCTPRHVPAKVIAVPDVPYTINGKKVELAVKKVIEGKEVLNKDALRNPEALDGYKDIEELKS
jgi:acetoacetyl-CoA synthetase